MDFYGELEWRGLLADATEGVREVLAREKVTGYIGFDPTAASLHVGSLLVITLLARLQRWGHTPIAVVGGGTGLIGDPSGKTAERQLLTEQRAEENVRGIHGQLARFLDFEASGNAARLVNNAEWLTTLGAIEFMREVGKHFTVNAMLAKESVRRRIESEDGISFTEFSYSLLQAYDYLMLYDRYGCTLQMGGTDQYGNILAGMDLIRRVRGGKAHGLVAPLITTASGAKFGKTEAGAIWLDPALTSPYKFYQFWLNVDDRDAVRYLKFFTFLEAAAIEQLAEASAREPERRHAQRELAREVTRYVHGAAAVADAEGLADKLFRQDLRGMSEDELLQAFGKVPSAEIMYTPEGWAVAEFLSATRVAASKSEGMRLVKGGGISVNDVRLADERGRVTPDVALFGRYFVVRRGKRENHLVRMVGGVDSTPHDS